MLEFIKQYTDDNKLIKLAEEILSEFRSEKNTSKKPILNLEKLSIHNFGNLKQFEMKFDKDIVFFEGDRNSGKSWAMESPLYLLTGSSRDKKGVVGDCDKTMYGELLLNKDLKIMCNRSEKSAKLEIRKGDFIVSTSIMDLDKIMKNYTNLDMELMTSCLYYSPRLSFQFSRALPYQIEELLIKVANLDIWLDLESFVKQFKKKEEEKLFELQGTIGYISDQDLDKDDLKKEIEENKKQINEIDQKLLQIKIPDISEYTKKYQKIQNQIEQKNDTQEKIDKFDNSDTELKYIKGKLDKNQKKMKECEIDEKEIENIEKEINEQTEKLYDIKNRGQNLKEQIDNNKKIMDKSICPILNKECQDLKENNGTVKKETDVLEAERQDLLKEYEKTQKGISLYQFRKSEIIQKKENYIRYKDMMQTYQGSINDIEKLLKSIDIEKSKKDLIERCIECGDNLK